MRVAFGIALLALCVAHLSACGQRGDGHDHAVFEQDLLDSLRSGSPPARLDAARSFLELEPSKRAADELRSAMTDSNARVRVAAARSLARWPEYQGSPDQLLAVLRNALDMEDAEVRAEAAQALGSLGRAAVGLVPRLEHAANDTNTSVRDEARTALRAIRRAPGS